MSKQWSLSSVCKIADVGWSDAMRYHNGVSGSLRQQWPLISGHYVSFVSFVLRQQHFLLVPSSYLANTRLRALLLGAFPFWRHEPEVVSRLLMHRPTHQVCWRLGYHKVKKRNSHWSVLCWLLRQYWFWRPQVIRALVRTWTELQWSGHASAEWWLAILGSFHNFTWGKMQSFDCVLVHFPLCLCTFVSYQRLRHLIGCWLGSIHRLGICVIPLIRFLGLETEISAENRNNCDEGRMFEISSQHIICRLQSSGYVDISSQRSYRRPNKTHFYIFHTRPRSKQDYVCADYLHFVLKIIFVGMKNAVVDKDISAPDRDATTIKGWHTLK